MRNGYFEKKIWVDGMLVQGAGLGPNGTPMRGVRVSLEIKEAKAEIMNEIQRLNETLEELKAQVTNLMQVTNSQVQQTTPAVVQNIPNPMQNVANPLAALGSLLTNQLQPVAKSHPTKRNCECIGECTPKFDWF